MQTTVATMRWAAARVDISPLALPSPEHELTDPMRGVTATVPGSHSRDSSLGTDLLTPGGTMRPRLSSFWAGTTDVQTRLATIEGSPSEPVLQAIDLVPESSNSNLEVIDEAHRIADSSSGQIDSSLAIQLPLPATAPALHYDDKSVAPPMDYFGNARHLVRSSSEEKLGSASPIVQSNIEPIFSSDEPLLSAQALTVPAESRRISLTRQSSSPLPISIPVDQRPMRVRGRVSRNNTPKKSNKISKFEQAFYNLGYLVSPFPPDELDRRRALYK